jgi:predicted GNAT family N-acyltransferase
LIIKKAFRGLKLSLKILIKTHEISKKKKLPMMLICKKKLIKFYEKQGWVLLGNSNIKFLDHKFNTFAMIYCSKTDFKKKFLNKTINILIDK